MNFLSPPFDELRVTGIFPIMVSLSNHALTLTERLYFLTNSIAVKGIRQIGLLLGGDAVKGYPGGEITNSPPGLDQYDLRSDGSFVF